MTTRSPTGDRAADVAAAALTEVGRDPRGALQAADRAVSLARAAADPAAAATAHRAAALAWRELGDLDQARRRGAAGVRVAVRGSLATEEAEARMTLAFIQLEQGSVRAAMHQADLATAAAAGLAAARVATQRALILQRTGRLDEALARYAEALPLLRRHRDRVWEARLLNNRGMAFVDQGQLSQATADFTASRNLLLGEGLTALAAGAEWNLALVAARRGDVPLALARFDAAQADHLSRGTPLPQLLIDRAEVLLSVGLATEAATFAAQAAHQLSGTGQHADRAQATLVLAQALASAGDPAAARARADEARRMFVRQGRGSWAVLARLTALRAAELAGDQTPLTLQNAAIRCADAVRAAGWPIAEMEARSIAARAARLRGDTSTEIDQLRRAVAHRRVGTLDARLRGFYAQALLRDAHGDRRGAEAALLAGVKVLDEYHALLGATELRVHASGVSVELTATGLGWAVERGDPRRTLGWADRGRSRATRPRPVRPPRDAAVTAALAQVRRLQAQTAQAQLDGGPRPGAAQRRAAEHLVVVASRKAGGMGAVDLDPDPAHLAVTLGRSVLLEFVEHAGALLVVVVRDGRFRMCSLGAQDHREGIDRLHFLLRRMTSGIGSDNARKALLGAARTSAAALGEALLGPVRADLADREVVVVPSAGLHAVPWSLLPALADRAVHVTPSAAAWCAATKADREIPAGGRRELFVAGPGLPGAATEVAVLAAAAPSAMLFGPSSSGTVDARPALTEDVLHALDGTDLAHIAAHGERRSDNPLFSALMLDDGPLTIYDLEGLRVAPGVVVLSSCESGVSASRAGDELVGLVSALLSIGTRTVIATGIDTPDAPTAELMQRLHVGLRAGERPAVALAGARRALDQSDPATYATAGGFLCFGA